MSDGAYESLPAALNKLLETIDKGSEMVRDPIPGTVTFSTGETRDNFAKSVQKIFSQIGVYPDAVTGNAAVSEGAVFGVIKNTDGQYSLDIYQKINGQPVLRLSNQAAKANNNAGIATPLMNYGFTPGYRNWNGDEAPGDYAESHMTVSEFIPVRKGQCVRISFTPNNDLTAGGHNTVALYDTNKAGLGSLIYGNQHVNFTEGDFNLYNEGDEADRSSAYHLRIPRDGFVKISFESAMFMTATIAPISFNEFSDQHRWSIGKFNLKRMEADTGGIYSILYTDLSKIINANNELVYSASNALSDFYPIKKGQWLTAVSGGGTNSNFFFYDTNKNFSSKYVSSRGFSSTSYGFSEGIFTIESTPSPIDGYVRLRNNAGQLGFDDCGLIFITNSYYPLEYNWVSQGFVPQKIPNKTTSTANMGKVLIDSGTEETFTTLHIPAGLGAKIQYTVGDVSIRHSFLMNDGQDSIVSGLATAQDCPVFGVPSIPGDYVDGGTLHQVGDSYVTYVFAQHNPIHVAVNTATGTGSVEIMNETEMRADRDALLPSLRAGTSINPGISYPYGKVDRKEGLIGIGFIPLFPNEVLICTTNRYSTNMSSLYSFNDTKSDLSYRIPITLGLVSTSSAAFTKFIQNKDEFMYASLTAVGSRDDFLGDGKAYVLSQDEFVEQYMDTGKSLIPEEMMDVYFASQWSDRDTNTSLAFSSIAAGTSKAGMLSIMPPLFIRKGQCYHWLCNTANQVNQRTPFVAYYNNGGTPVLKALTDCGPQPANSNWITAQPMGGYLRAEDDGCIFLMRRRENDADGLSDANKRLVSETSQLECHLISDDTYNRNKGDLYEDRLLVINDPSGLEFKMVDGPYPYDRDGYEYNHICQIWQNGAHITNVMLKTGVQGQSSAGESKNKMNIDFKAYNKDGKKIKIKIGEWKQTDKLVLKALKGGDPGRDMMCSELYRIARRYGRDYPDNTIIDPVVLDMGKTVREFQMSYDSVGSTQGWPVGVYYGDVYFGMYYLRTKKDAINYGVLEEDNRFIWLQADSTWDKANGNNWLTDWRQFRWENWEVTQPEIKGYTVGQPSTDPVVGTQVPRFFNWVAGCSNGEDGYNFDDDAEKYLYVSSWIDYLIMGELFCHWDGYRHNTILACHDTQAENPRWTIYLYDLDHTLGNVTSSYDGNSVFYKNDAGVFKLLMDSEKYRPIVIDRYLQLRNGPLERNNLMKFFSDYNKAWPYEYFDKDADLWAHSQVGNFPAMLSWLDDRLTFLDGYFK